MSDISNRERVETAKVRAEERVHHILQQCARELDKLAYGTSREAKDYRAATVAREDLALDPDGATLSNMRYLTPTVGRVWISTDDYTMHVKADTPDEYDAAAQDARALLSRISALVARDRARAEEHARQYDAAALSPTSTDTRPE